MKRVAAVSLVVAALAAACNLQEGIGDGTDAAATTSTTSTTEPAPTTTTITLPPEETAERGVVTTVIDGDTFAAVVAGVEVTVRLLGINAPETDECFGSDARSTLTRLLGGFEVVMEAGPEEIDDFGRMLRYVYVEDPDGTMFVNQDLVAEGFAVGVQSDHPNAAAFEALEAAAFASGKGMWGSVVCGEIGRASCRERV